jgi:hypothetical protein
LYYSSTCQIIHELSETRELPLLARDFTVVGITVRVQSPSGERHRVTSSARQCEL